MDKPVSANAGRSLARVEVPDLLYLAELAAAAEAELLDRHPRGSGRYSDRLLCRALCQGAALHYRDRKNGVKDFGVWSFYTGRRVDLMGRSLRAEPGADPLPSCANT